MNVHPGVDGSDGSRSPGECRDAAGAAAAGRQGARTPKRTPAIAWPWPPGIIIIVIYENESLTSACLRLP